MGRSVCSKQTLDRQGTPSLYQHYVSTATHQLEYEGFCLKKEGVVYTGEESVAGATIASIGTKDGQAYIRMANTVPGNAGGRSNRQHHLDHINQINRPLR